MTAPQQKGETVKKLLALAGAVAAALTLAATPAFAQEENACADEQAAVQAAEGKLAEARAERDRLKTRIDNNNNGEEPTPAEEKALAEAEQLISDIKNGELKPAREALEKCEAASATPTTPPTSEPETPPTSEPETPPTSEPVDPTTEPTTPPTSEPVDPDPEPEPVFFRNCFEVFRKGAYPLFRGEPGYRPGLDRDDDGRACEREDFRRDRDDDDDDEDGDDGKDGTDGRDGKDGRDGEDGRDGRDGVSTLVSTSDDSNSADVPLPVGGIATGGGPA